MKKILLFTACLNAHFMGFAQSTALDPNFGSGGKSTLDIGGADDGWSVAIQNDGKILLGGWGGAGFAMARFNSNGTPDNSFDTDGKVSTSIGPDDHAHALALQSDGKIILAGRSWNGSNYDIAVMRFNADGSLDNSFDTDGKVTVDIAGMDDFAFAVTVQSDGKIVAAGHTATAGPDDAVVVRFNSNGSLDNTFDGDGKVTTDVANTTEAIYAVKIQGDGKIIIAGRSGLSTQTDMLLLRYNSDGSLDNSFDGDGKVVSAIGTGNEGVYSLAIQTDGKLVAGGWIGLGAPNGEDFIVARYNSNGSLDNTFDADGFSSVDFGGVNDVGRSVAIQSDGKIVIGGWAGQMPSAFDFALARFNSNGSLDNTFDSDGKITTDFNSGADFCYSIAVQNDGKIVAGGTVGSDFALARYDANLASVSENFATNEILVYPNPSGSGKITVRKKFQSKEMNLIVRDILGNVIHDAALTEELSIIDLQNQAKGIYFLELSFENENLTRKIVLD